MITDSFKPGWRFLAFFLSFWLVFSSCSGESISSENSGEGYNRYALQKSGYSSAAELWSVLFTKGFDSTNNLFRWCCDYILYYAVLMGLTYEELNLILFVFLEPALILLLLFLYLRERRRNRASTSSASASSA